MAKKDYSDYLNPFGDPFKIQQQPRGGIKKPRKKPSVAPEPRALYDLQTDLLKALSALEKEDYDGAAKRPLRDAYKIINRYLRTYVQGSMEKNDTRGNL